MNLPTEKIYQCECKIYDALISSKRARLMGVSNLQAAEMAGRSVLWAQRGYQDNLVGSSLRREVRREFADRYGSILTIVLFTIIWELIKKYLFESSVK